MTSRQLPSILLLSICLVWICQNTESQNQSPDSNPDQCSGIVSSIDHQGHKVTLRMQSQSHPEGEITSTWTVSSATKILKEDRSNGSLADIKTGSVVTCRVKQESQLDTIVMQSACTPKTCARQQCDGKCKSLGCRCPKN